MKTSQPLEVLFLTNFTDYSYQSIPAIAQMADDFVIHLTIAHVIPSTANPSAEAQARTQLMSFFPEADYYAGTERCLLRGNPVEALLRLAHSQPVNLLIAPAADPLGLPRIGHRSLRLRLMRECGLPVWTIGRRTDVSKLRRPAKNVACWMDFRDPNLNHFAYALEYSHKLNLPLHILHALPEVNEGTMIPDGWPLREEGAIQELKKRIGWSFTMPLSFHVTDEPGARAGQKLIRESGADIVFIAGRQPYWNWMPLPKPPMLDACDCPVVCIPAELRVPVWNLELESRLAPVGRDIVRHRNGEALRQL